MRKNISAIHNKLRLLSQICLPRILSIAPKFTWPDSNLYLLRKWGLRLSLLSLGCADWSYETTAVKYCVWNWTWFRWKDAYIFTFWQIQIMYITYNVKLQCFYKIIKNSYTILVKDQFLSRIKNQLEKIRKRSALIRFEKLIKTKGPLFRMESVDNPDKSLKKKTMLRSTVKLGYNIPSWF